MLNKKAVRNPDTAKPSTNLSAKRIIIALITNKNKPSVTMVAGRVKKIKSGFTKIFSKANTTETINAEKKSDTKTPGSR